jgi:pyrimidine-nucleoside phosphorylase
MSFLVYDLIKKKRNGEEHTQEELRHIISGFVDGSIPEYQMSAWLMSVYFRGMTPKETASLTELMLHSGCTLDFSRLPGIAVDKHSTGGVGDKTSMILAPLVAAAGVYVPMIAGRGLGHTGGTLDKLESIPGFRIDLSLSEFDRQVEKIGTAIIGQTGEICPADRKIYALRDVTATIESLPLICASIMSKKLAEGIGALVLDVKFGSGAFMKTVEEAEILGTKLMEIGKAHGKDVAVLLTQMEEPLGRFIGNSLEIEECISILKNEPRLGRPVKDFIDTTELTLELAAYMIWLGQGAADLNSSRTLAKEALTSGRAWEKFCEMCEAQGGVVAKLPTASRKTEITATASGYVAKYDTERIGIAALTLGAGRFKSDDLVDPAAGIEVHKKLGDAVFAGERLFTLYSNQPAESAKIATAAQTLLAATTISLQKPAPIALIAKRLVTR